MSAVCYLPQTRDVRMRTLLNKSERLAPIKNDVKRNLK